MINVDEHRHLCYGLPPIKHMLINVTRNGDKIPPGSIVLINECILRPDICGEGTCKDTVVGYECICKSGFKNGPNKACEGNLLPHFISKTINNYFLKISMNVAKENVKMVGVRIRLEVTVVSARQVLISHLMVANVRITTNVKKLVCVQMGFVSTWTEVLNVIAMPVINYPHLDMLVLILTNATKILESVLTDGVITLPARIRVPVYLDLSNRTIRLFASIWTNAQIQVLLTDNALYLIYIEINQTIVII